MEMDSQVVHSKKDKEINLSFSFGTRGRQVLNVGKYVLKKLNFGHNVDKRINILFSHSRSHCLSMSLFAESNCIEQSSFSYGC